MVHFRQTARGGPKVQAYNNDPAYVVSAWARAKPATPPPFPTTGSRAVPTPPAFPTAAPGRPAANPPTDTSERVTHHGDNHVSGLSGSGEGPVVGVNYGTIQHRRDSGS